jgi:hypothetical protein
LDDHVFSEQGERFDHGLNQEMLDPQWTEFQLNLEQLEKLSQLEQKMNEVESLLKWEKKEDETELEMLKWKNHLERDEVKLDLQAAA